MNKEERVEVFKDTTRMVAEGKYTYGNTEIGFSNTRNMRNNTKFYTNKVTLYHEPLPKYETTIKVIDEDCLEAAMELVNNGFKPCVLNMASFHTPGGGVERGSSAQEESIFRRTDIYQSLYQFHPVGEDYRIKQREERYPLQMRYGCIYTPGVTVFRKPETENCGLMQDPFLVDVITMPAVRKPTIDRNGHIPRWAEEVLEGKVKQLMDVCLENGNDSLVLSAFGCGAYGTPPKIVARIFHEVIDSDEYRSLFKAIYFAIINVQATNGIHNPEGNFKPFVDEFTGQ